MMRKYTVFITLLCVINWGNAQRIIGYYPSYRDGAQTQIEFDKLTDVIFAFINFNSANGALDLTNVGALDNLIAAARLDNPNIRIHISTGGGAFGGGNFNSLTSNSTARGNFVSNMTSFIVSRNLDGWNLDWEYPGTQIEQNRHELLVKEMYQSLKAKQSTICKFLDVSLAVDGVSSGVHINLNTVSFADYLIVMSYDAPAFVAPNHSTEFMAESSIDGWYSWGVPYDKLVLAVPFYGWNLARDNALTYSQIAAGNPAAAYNNASDLMNGFYYNSSITLQNKIDFSFRSGKELLGIGIWELGQDRMGQTYSLLNAIYTKLKSSYGISGPSGDPCTLPVTFLNVDFLNEESQMLIRWRATDEYNTAYYVIYKSFDGINYNAIGKVNKDILYNSGEYQFQDEYTDTDTGYIYYRISEIDYGGDVAHGPISSIKRCIGDRIKILSVQEKLFIIQRTICAVDEEANYWLVNTSGNVLRESKLKNGIKSEILDLSSLTSGVYVLIYKSADYSEKHKLVII